MNTFPEVFFARTRLEIHRSFVEPRTGVVLAVRSEPVGLALRPIRMASATRLFARSGPAGGNAKAQIRSGSRGAITARRLNNLVVAPYVIAATALVGLRTGIGSSRSGSTEGVHGGAFALCVALVNHDSAVPDLLRQKRVDVDVAQFTMVKFRNDFVGNRSRACARPPLAREGEQVGDCEDRGDTGVRSNLHFVGNWSLLSDLRIMWHIVSVALGPMGAHRSC